MVFVPQKEVLYEKRDGRAYIRLNRPEALNALNEALRAGIAEAIADGEEDDGITCFIVIGEGGKAFCAGADLKELARRGAGGTLGEAALPDEVVARCRKPVIAAIDGYCLAGGLELALRCDIRVATEASQFGLPEPRRSLLAGYGLHHLSRMVPLGEALHMQLTGAPIGAWRAYDIGLIQRLCADRDALIAAADAIADEIALCAPLAVQAIKRIVRTGRDMPVEASVALARPILEAINKTEDRLEGPRAFAEKRKPRWQMR